MGHAGSLAQYVEPDISLNVVATQVALLEHSAWQSVAEYGAEGGIVYLYPA